MMSVHEAMSIGSVLVVDDDQVSRRVTKHILIDCGCEVTEADSGRAALQRLEESKPDLLLLDVVMPEFDGETTLRLIRENPALHDLHVVVLSASNQMDHVRKMAALRIFGYIMKPVDRFELQNRVVRILKSAA